MNSATFASTIINKFNENQKLDTLCNTRGLLFHEARRHVLAYPIAMVSMLAPTAADREYLLQRSMERQVLGLLRVIQKPQALAAAPLMRAVCRATGEANALAAFEHVVGAALAGESTNAAKLRSAIFDVDFNRGATNAELAQRCGISRRHFQRWRAEAISAIARYARTIVETSTPQPPAVPSRPCVSVTRFERERETYLQARDRGNALEMHAIAGNLLRLADGPDAFALACTWRVDASLRLSKFDEALDNLRRVGSPANLLRKAQLALLRNDLEQAEEYGQEAFDALARDDIERYQSLVVISQARLGRAFSWRPPLGCSALPRGSWEHGAVAIECARHLAREGQWQRAEALARVEHGRAATLGYRGLAARAAAVLHACARVREDRVGVEQWRALAIEHLLTTQDRFIAMRLFLRTAYDERCGLDPSLDAVLYRRLCLIIPQMLGESAQAHAAACEFLGALLDAAIATGSDRRRLERAAARVRRLDGALAHYEEKAADAIGQMLALVLLSATGLDWDVLTERLRGMLDQCASKLRPTAPRAFAIGIPLEQKSQFVVTNHLKVDDERSVEDESSLERVAGLRVRVVPSRSVAGLALPWSRRHSASGSARAAAGSPDSR